MTYNSYVMGANAMMTKPGAMRPVLQVRPDFGLAKTDPSKKIF